MGSEMCIRARLGVFGLVVDDGREYPQALQRAPAPHLMDRYIKDFEYNPYNLNSDEPLRIACST